MYLLGEQPAYADRLINRLQTIPTQLLEGLQPSGPNLELKHTDDLCAELPHSNFSSSRPGYCMR